ncbi:uncharacterized protein LOC122059420 isoform X3 [Macadamia integrifolia]|uniref:uncharacterized protein LOC122059420 isoform X3 n=1 Tax=Macadamia integrifolia TaxID=60698 RepID=UPI001C52A8CF|nr:uncharacterized protein LOC122059420 isoform X3 [Macadamia integrifolia]
MLSLNLPGLFMSPVSSNGFRQWLWCGNMEKNLGMNLGKGFLGVWFTKFRYQLSCHITKEQGSWHRYPCLVEHFVHAHAISFTIPSPLRY